MLAIKSLLHVSIVMALVLSCGFIMPNCLAQNKQVNNSGQHGIKAPISKQKSSKHEQLLTLKFKRIAVHDLVQFIAEFADKNVFIDSSVKGYISLNLTDVTWKEALGYIASSLDLNVKYLKHVIKITAQNKNAENTKVGVKKHKAIARMLHIYYAKAEDLAKALVGSKEILGKDSGVVVNKRTNSLLLKSSPDNLRQLAGYVKQIDVPEKQVAIDAQIVFMDQTSARELGLLFATSNKSKTTTALSNSNSVSMDLPNGVDNPGHFMLALMRLEGDLLLDMELNALESEGRAEVISHPKLITSNLHPAYIESGEEVPYQERSGEGVTNVAFKKAVLSLKVTPQVARNHEIALDLVLNQDKVSQLTFAGVPAIQTREIKTKVIVKDGETIALGGIYEIEKNRVVTKIPFLSAIPILGQLFKNNKWSSERKELLIFVTPHVL